MEELNLLTSQGFQVLQELGYGASGRVYLVYHPYSNIGVAAAKVIRNEDFNEQEWNIAGVFEQDPPQMRPFVIHYILAKQFEKHTVILMDYFEGIRYIHSKNLIHRDIKGGNIMLHCQPGSGRVNLKITDFGIVKVNSEDEKTMQMTAIGTEHYMAPELILGNGEEQVRADSKVDIWSLGILFFKLASHRFPCSQQKIQSINTFMNKYQQTRILDRPQNIKNDLLWDLLVRMLQFDRKDRISAESALQHPFFTDEQAMKEITPEQYQLAQTAQEALQNGDQSISQFDTIPSFIFPLIEVQNILGPIDPQIKMNEIYGKINHLPQQQQYQNQFQNLQYNQQQSNTPNTFQSPFYLQQQQQPQQNSAVQFQNLQQNQNSFFQNANIFGSQYLQFPQQQYQQQQSVQNQQKQIPQQQLFIQPQIEQEQQNNQNNNLIYPGQSVEFSHAYQSNLIQQPSLQIPQQQNQQQYPALQQYQQYAQSPTIKQQQISPWINHSPQYYPNQNIIQQQLLVQPQIEDLQQQNEPQIQYQQQLNQQQIQIQPQKLAQPLPSTPYANISPSYSTPQQPSMQTSQQPYNSVAQQSQNQVLQQPSQQQQQIPPQSNSPIAPEVNFHIDINNIVVPQQMEQYKQQMGIENENQDQKSNEKQNEDEINMTQIECEICKQKIPFSQYQEHVDEYHKRNDASLPKPKSSPPKQNVDQSNINNQGVVDKFETKVECEACHQQIPFSQYQEHLNNHQTFKIIDQNQDQNQIDKQAKFNPEDEIKIDCEICHQQIPFSQYQTHSDSHVAQSIDKSQKNLPNFDKKCKIKPEQQIPCEICKQKITFSKYQQHVDGHKTQPTILLPPPPKPQRQDKTQIICRICNQQILASQYQQHLNEHNAQQRSDIPYPQSFHHQLSSSSSSNQQISPQSNSPIPPDVNFHIEINNTIAVQQMEQYKQQMGIENENQNQKSKEKLKQKEKEKEKENIHIQGNNQKDDALIQCEQCKKKIPFSLYQQHQQYHITQQNNFNQNVENVNRNHGVGRGGGHINHQGNPFPSPPNPQPKQQINNIKQIHQHPNQQKSQPTLIQCEFCGQYDEKQTSDLTIKELENQHWDQIDKNETNEILNNLHQSENNITDDNSSKVNKQDDKQSDIDNVSHLIYPLIKLNDNNLEKFANNNFSLSLNKYQQNYYQSDNVSMKSHISSNQINNNKLECNICHEQIPTFNIIEHLVEKHDKSTPVKCECGQYIRLGHYKTHTLFHMLDEKINDRKLMKCEVCGIELNPKLYYFHLKTQHNSKQESISCRLCGQDKKKVNKQYYSIHLYAHKLKEETKQKNNLEKRKRPDQITSDVSIPKQLGFGSKIANKFRSDSNKMVQCKYCKDQPILLVNQLEQHNEEEHQNNSVEICYGCGKLYLKTEMPFHQQKHSIFL